eukprot:6514055-Pyramimonas_sp.AAC.1
MMLASYYDEHEQLMHGVAKKQDELYYHGMDEEQQSVAASRDSTIGQSVLRVVKSVVWLGVFSLLVWLTVLAVSTTLQRVDDNTAAGAPSCCDTRCLLSCYASVVLESQQHDSLLLSVCNWDAGVIHATTYYYNMDTNTMRQGRESAAGTNGASAAAMAAIVNEQLLPADLVDESHHGLGRGWPKTAYDVVEQ